MTKGDVLELFQYNQWVKARLLKSLGAMKVEDLAKDLRSSHGGILGTLLHMVNAEGVWTRRLQGEPIAPIKAEDVKSLADLQAKWDDLDHNAADLISGYSEEDLQSDFEYKDLKGNAYRQPRVWAFTQLFNHFTYHRGQIVAMERQLGYEPINTDIITFYRQNRGKTR